MFWLLSGWIASPNNSIFLQSGLSLSFQYPLSLSFYAGYTEIELVGAHTLNHIIFSILSSASWTYWNDNVLPCSMAFGFLVSVVLKASRAILDFFFSLHRLYLCLGDLQDGRLFPAFAFLFLSNPGSRSFGVLRRRRGTGTSFFSLVAIVVFSVGSVLFL